MEELLLEVALELLAALELAAALELVAALELAAAFELTAAFELDDSCEDAMEEASLDDTSEEDAAVETASLLDAAALEVSEETGCAEEASGIASEVFATGAPGLHALSVNSSISARAAAEKRTCLLIFMTIPFRELCGFGWLKFRSVTRKHKTLV